VLPAEGLPDPIDLAPSFAWRRSTQARDLEGFRSSQVKIAADLGASTASAAKATVSTLRAKGEDLIGVGGRHREGNKAAGIGEIKRRSAGGGPHAPSPRNAVPTSRSALILSSGLLWAVRRYEPRRSSWLGRGKMSIPNFRAVERVVVLINANIRPSSIPPRWLLDAVPKHPCSVGSRGWSVPGAAAGGGRYGGASETRPRPLLPPRPVHSSDP
jgi:hypothetical protein